MIGLIGTIQTSTNANIYASTFSCISRTWGGDGPTLCMGKLAVGGATNPLSGTGGAYELTVLVGGYTVQPVAQTITFGTETSSAVWTSAFPIVPGDIIILKLKSPNSAETGVDVVASIWDISAFRVWDELRTSHTTSGTFGESYPSSGNIATASATSVWGSVRASHTTAGTFGQGAASVQGSVTSVTGSVGSVTGNVGGNVVGSAASVTGAVGSVTGAVGSVTGSVASVTGAVGSIAAAGITSSSFATDSITAAAIVDAAANKIADHVLKRVLATAEASSDGDAVSFRSLLGAIAKLVNKVNITGGNLYVHRTDDVTQLGTQALTTDSTAQPIISADTV